MLYHSCQYSSYEHCSTIVNILQLTVGYLNATINGKTTNAEPEIGHNGLCQTRQNQGVNGYGARCGPPRSSGSGFWTVQDPNRTDFLVQTRTAGGLPGPVANTIGVCCYCVNSGSLHGEIDRDDLTSCSYVMVELSTTKRGMRGHGENHHEKLRLGEFNVRVN